MVREGRKAVTAGTNPIALKRGIDAAASATSDALLAQAREVDEKDEIAHVATMISAQDCRDRQADRRGVQQGPAQDGVITVGGVADPGPGARVHRGHTCRFDKGYISPYFITDQDRLGSGP